MLRNHAVIIMSSEDFPTTIRNATVADIPAMMDLGATSRTAPQWNEQHYSRIFADDDGSRKVLVIEKNSRILGFIVARGFSGEWEIENILVSPSDQRRGLATQLLKEFMKSIPKNLPVSIFLEVREGNCAARALYEKQGFQPVGKRKSYYSGPEEDAIVYRIGNSINCTSPGA
jgi:ribosomal-protein-alanine N-acetyltransferase